MFRASGQPRRPRSGPPVFNLPPITKGLAIGLLAIHLLLHVLLPHLLGPAVEWLAFSPAAFLAQFQPDHSGRTSLHEWGTLLSHMALHADWPHVILNTGFLLAIGSAVERAIGRPAFVLFLAITGAAGALTLTALVGPAPVIVIGASGAVYGCLGAATRLYAWRLGGLKAAAGFVAVLLILNVLLGFVGFGDTAGSAIAWQAHLGGFIAGLVLILALPRRVAPG
ncbi:MAG: rhomboid family intramembrane serine protease [Alphaproteobacteria bacterium]